MQTSRDYVLVTPVKNEALHIERTIRSVLAQTAPPIRWIIVSDGSTDGTDEIVAGFVEVGGPIRLLRANSPAQGNFGSKVRAFRMGYEQLEGVSSDFVGNLDGDVTFEPDYFERLIEKFSRDESLGLAGGCIHEQIGEGFHARSASRDSVAGAVQFFRRDVYEAIGGYTPQAAGGIDSIAEIMVRMRGRTVRTFDDLAVRHHGRVTGGQKNILMSRFAKGRINYLLGYSPLFQFLVSLYRMRNRPWIVGGMMMLSGYVTACIRRPPRAVSPEFVAFVRHEQRRRILARLAGRGA